MDQAAVPQVHLRRLDQAPADVPGERRQAPEEQQVGEQVEVAVRRPRRDAQRRGEPRGIQQPALGMGEHRPQPGHGARRGARREPGDVPSHHRPQEVVPDLPAAGVVLRPVTLGESAAQPEPPPRRRIVLDFQRVERAEFHLGDPPGEALPGAGQEVERRRAEQQELPGAHAAPPPPVDHAAQDAQDLRRPVDLVEDDQPVFVGFEEQGGVAQFRQVRRVFEIEVEPALRLGDGERQGGLPDLPGAEEEDGRLPVQRLDDGREDAAGDHRPCILGTTMSDMHGRSRCPAVSSGAFRCGRRAWRRDGVRTSIECEGARFATSRRRRGSIHRLACEGGRSATSRR